MPIGSSCCSTSGPERECLGFSQGQGTIVRDEQSCWLGQCTSLGAQLTWLIQYQISSTQAGHNGTLENQNKSWLVCKPHPSTTDFAWRLLNFY